MSSSCYSSITGFQLYKPNRSEYVGWKNRNAQRCLVPSHPRFQWHKSKQCTRADYYQLLFAQKKNTQNNRLHVCEYLPFKSCGTLSQPNLRPNAVATLRTSQAFENFFAMTLIKFYAISCSLLVFSVNLSENEQTISLRLSLIGILCHSAAFFFVCEHFTQFFSHLFQTDPV